MSDNRNTMEGAAKDDALDAVKGGGEDVRRTYDTASGVFKEFPDSKMARILNRHLRKAIMPVKK